MALVRNVTVFFIVVTVIVTLNFCVTQKFDFSFNVNAALLQLVFQLLRDAAVKLKPDLRNLEKNEEK